ncbi:MAG: PEP-utilizing enzyme [Planctomycetes bacterium]|nr:PEP-utilizing enzyme [Planctomycetota bacterium]
MNDQIILWLNERLQPAEEQSIGPKAVSLCTLRRLGQKVPPCFFLTTAAFRAHLDQNGLRARMAARLKELPSQPEEIPGAIERIRQRILRVPLPDSVREQVAAAYDRLGAAVVAVRSSANAEDLPGHSFAGQYETILNVRSLEACLEAVQRCWASLWTLRAYEYRRRNGIDHRQVEMAVIVQQQIEPDAAGVAFSVDPVTGSRSRIVIESCRGLGEALVSGQVQPDRILLRKKNLALIRQHLAASEPCLGLKSARRLARGVRRIEERLGGPQDVEWALRDGTLWFLQARPITALPEPKAWEDRQVWTNLNLGEVAPDVMTPMTYSIIMLMFEPLFVPVFRLVGADVRRHPPAGLVAGRVYFNINTGLAAARPFAAPDRLAAMNHVFGGEQNRSFERGQFDICEEDLPDVGFRWPRYILSWPGLIRSLIAHRPSKNEAFKAAFKTRNDAVARFDSTAATTAELTRMVTQTLHENMKDCELLYLWPGSVASFIFQRACRNWLRDADQAVGFRLLTAQGGMADTEAAHDLWRLAALAHEDAGTETILLEDGAWESIHPRLAATDHGRRFLDAWDRFMTTHGQHCHCELEFFSPRWSEMPDYVLGLMRGYLRALDRADPLEKHRQLAAERERLTEQCRRRLPNPVKRWVFTWSLRATQNLTRDRENWKNEAVRLFAGFRRIFLELGERLRQQGILAAREDIFFLDIAEVEPVVQGRAGFDVKQRIAQRRAEYEWNMAQTPPPVVVGRYDPQKHRASQVDTNTRVLKGIAVSPGTATGKARVITQPNNGQHVEPGEILVAPVTNPAWTPYFLPAAGAVMDMGGILSHGAIIAREYGLPAVVNVGPASQIIRTGQTLRVDGDQGTVTILDGI